MGQQVNRSSKVKSPSESDWTIISIILLDNKIIILRIYSNLKIIIILVLVNFNEFISFLLKLII